MCPPSFPLSPVSSKVKKKINGSFSGGQETKELQELHGANINVSGM